MIRSVKGPIKVGVSIKADDKTLLIEYLESDGTLIMNFDCPPDDARALAKLLLHRANLIDALHDDSELSKRAMRIYKETTQYISMTGDQEYLTNQYLRKMLVEQPNLTDQDYQMMIRTWILGYWRG